MVQKVVELTAPIGVPGGIVALQEEYTPVNYISDGTLHAGGFAFVSKEKLTPETGVDMPVAGHKGDVFLGVVVRDATAALVSFTDPCTYGPGEEVFIVRSGDVYIKAPGEAKVDQVVTVKTEDGTVAVADKAGEGEIDTGWRVATEAKQQGDIIIISNRGDASAKSA